jgi:gamma-glutamyltranspeptidase / glutathione hydrolase
VLEQGDVDMLALATDDFRQDLPSARIFLHRSGLRKSQETPFEVGQTLVQKNLARTLKSISRAGVDGFYRGPVARELVRAMRAGGGIISAADLQNYSTRELPPLECDYRGYHLISAPPPSSGGTTICESLNILQAYPLRHLGFGAAQGVHYQIEAMRHAFVDRNNYLGDPAFVKNPLARLLDLEYAKSIRAVIDPNRAGVSAEIAPGIAPHEGNNTTHYSIADQFGNAVSVTYTLNDWFGARVTAGDTGIILNNEMDDFTAKIGVPNSYGLIQGAANKIAPGKRPLSSMSPTILSKNGKPVMVLGTPGGSRIITAVLLTILNVVDYQMDVQQALDAPRFHQQWLPEATSIEADALSPDTRKILLAMGHRFDPPQPENHVAAILIGAPKLGGAPVGKNRFYGAIDPRRNTGSALGY